MGRIAPTGRSLGMKSCGLESRPDASPQRGLKGAIELHLPTLDVPTGLLNEGFPLGK